MTILTEVLRKALNRERLQSSLSDLGTETEIDIGNLCAFAGGKRGLSAAALERLSSRLGVRVTFVANARMISGPLLSVIRQALKLPGNSIRTVAHHTKIDPGNLTRFVNDRTVGLRMHSIDALCRHLRLNVEWNCTLRVEVLRELKVGHMIPNSGVSVHCFCARTRVTPELDMTQTSGPDGAAVFEDIPMGTFVEITVNGLQRGVEITENVQRYLFIL